MSSARAFLVLVTFIAAAGLGACGGATGGGDGGGEELAPPAAPQRVEATQGEHRDMVVVAWEPVPEADSYQVLRDGEQIGEVNSTEEDIQSYEDTGADVGDTFAAPEQVEAAYTETGVEVTWAAAEPGSQGAHDYTVVAVNAGGESEPSEAAEGYRAGAPLAHYEVEVDGSDEWVDVGEETTWTDDEPPTATIEFGQVSASQGSAHAFVELSAEQPQLAFDEQRSYRVRAVDVDGVASDASQEAALATEPDRTILQWQRTDFDDPNADYTALEADCANARECQDTSAPADGSVRHYQLKAVINIDDMRWEQLSSPVAGHKFGCVSDNEPFGGGNGSEAQPWRICSAQQLTRISETVKYDHFVLADSIDLSVLGEPFVPIESLAGEFDGRGHTIDNLTLGMDQSGYDTRAGLFRYVEEGARVANLKLPNIDLRVVSYLGAVAGDNLGEIVDVEVDGLITVPEGDFEFNVHRDANPGGIAGRNLDTGVIDGCTSHVDIVVDYSADRVGGLVGYNTGLVKKSLATGSLDTNGSYGIGGLVGYSNGPVESSKATGDVTGHNRVGGLIGELSWGGEVFDSYATGDVEMYQSSGAGLVGHSDGVIERAYATGEVIDEHGYTKGLVGTSGSNSTVEDAYWDEQTTGKSEGSGGTPLQTADFADPANFPGWSFAPDDDHVWKMGTDAEGNDRPLLWWE